jgi:hypothetical protein
MSIHRVSLLLLLGKWQVRMVMYVRQHVCRVVHLAVCALIFGKTELRLVVCPCQKATLIPNIKGEYLWRLYAICYNSFYYLTLDTVRPIYRTTAPLTSRCCILYIYSTNINIKYFKQLFLFLCYSHFTYRMC